MLGVPRQELREGELSFDALVPAADDELEAASTHPNSIAIWKFTTGSTGEALPRELYDEWRATFGVEVLDGIGSSEAYHIFISNRLGAARPGAAGVAVPGYRVMSADLFTRDGDGYFTFQGRADDLIKVSGVWVAQFELERALLEHPDVAECAVIGVDRGEDGIRQARPPGAADDLTGSRLVGRRLGRA